MWTSRTLRTLFALALMPALLAVISCDRHSTKETFYLVATRLSLPYWKTASAGFNQAATDYKVTARIEGPDGYDPQAELEALNRAVASKPAGILISVADEARLKSGIDAAVEAGVPVITFDSDAPSSRRLFFIGTNNLAAGRLGAERVVEKLGGHGNVVFFSMPGQPNLVERLNGYKDYFSAYPGMKIVQVVDIKGDARNAFDSTMQMLAATGDNKISAFICLEASTGKVVADALLRQKATDRVLIAMDVDNGILAEIKDGTIAATISQKPWTMAYVGLRELDTIFHDRPVSFPLNTSVDAFARYPNFIDTGTALVDKVNADMYSSSAAQHQ